MFESNRNSDDSYVTKPISMSKHVSFQRCRYSQIEQFLHLLKCVLGVLDRVPDCPGILVELVVVAALVCLVAEEMDCLVVDSVWFLGFGLEMREAVSLVPAVGEDVEGDLTAD